MRISKSNESAPWIQAQKSTFENWVNHCLKEKGESIRDSKVDFKDGLKLYALYQQLTGKTIRFIDKKPKMKISFLQNLNLVINSFKENKIKIINVQGEDIYEENLKLILGLLWMLIQGCHILGSEEGEKKTAAKKLLLDFVNNLVQNPKSKNFKSDWQDGVILSELINVIEPQSCPPHSRPSAAIDRVNHALNVAQQKLDVPKVIEAEFIVDAVDELSLMTYITYLKKKYEQLNATPFASFCVARGDGLHNSPNSSSPHVFQIELRNRYGSICSLRKATVEDEIKVQVSGPQKVECRMELEDGICRVEYDAVAPGNYLVDIKVGPKGESIKDSPFHLKIASAGHSISGTGTRDGVFEKNGKLRIEIDSGTRMAHLVQKDLLRVSVADPKGNDLPVKMADFENGRYIATFSPSRSGSYWVNVELGGETAFSKEISLESKAAKDTELSLSGEMAERKRFPENRATGFVVRLVNTDNEPFPDAEVEVSVKDANNQSAGKVRVSDKGNDVYEVTVDEIDRLGVYRVDLALNGEPKAFFTAECEKGVQPELVTGDFTFEIQARDKDGRPKRTGGDRWEVDVKGPDDAVIQVETNDLGDGRYTATYHLAAQESGPSAFQVNARLDGKHVAASPFKHELAPRPALGKFLGKT